jgi:putative transposase
MQSDRSLEFRRKYIRLPAEHYRGLKRVFLTFCCDHRRPHFSSPQAADWILRRLLERALAHVSLAHAWCVMPDHLHVFVEGTAESCDALKFASDFKQRTGFEWGAQRHTRLWQAKFYDHIVRSSEASERIAFYIWSNPVRKGLCKDFVAYPYSGSATIPFRHKAGGNAVDSSLARRGNSQFSPCRSEARRYETLKPLVDAALDLKKGE